MKRTGNVDAVYFKNYFVVDVKTAVIRTVKEMYRLPPQFKLQNFWGCQVGKTASNCTNYVRPALWETVGIRV
jgi:hypothetical protein